MHERARSVAASRVYSAIQNQHARCILSSGFSVRSVTRALVMQSIFARHSYIKHHVLRDRHKAIRRSFPIQHNVRLF